MLTWHHSAVTADRASNAGLSHRGFAAGGCGRRGHHWRPRAALGGAPGDIERRAGLCVLHAHRHHVAAAAGRAHQPAALEDDVGAAVGCLVDLQLAWKTHGMYWILQFILWKYRHVQCIGVTELSQNAHCWCRDDDAGGQLLRENGPLVAVQVAPVQEVPADTGTAAWYSSNMPCSSSRKAAT